jgi:hypothetical protein
MLSKQSIHISHKNPTINNHYFPTQDLQIGLTVFSVTFEIIFI